jgi:hypothetical protein
VGLTLLTERYTAQIAGVLSCFDRMLVFGTLPKVCFAGGMTSYLYERKVRIFDYPRFAEPFRNRLRENAEKLAADNGIEIEHIRKKNFRKEDRVKEVLAQRGEQPGLVCIFSAMEPCATYKPWHDKETGKTYLKPDDGKCLHYYFYFLDEELGLAYVRVPTWLPCRLQVYFNGHNWLAAQLRKRGIDHRLLDNAFVEIADWARPSASPMAGKPNGFIGNWTSWPNASARSTATLVSLTTGAWTNASTPPTSFSGGRPTCGPSTVISPEQQFTPSNRTISLRSWARSWSRNSEARWATGSISVSKARGSNTPWGRCP